MDRKTAVQKKNVLVVVSIMSQFPELFRLVQQLKKSDSFNPIVYFNLGSQAAPSNYKKCLDENVKVIDYYSGSSSQQTIAALRPGLFFRAKFFAKTKFPALFNITKNIYHFAGRANVFSFFFRVSAKIRRLKKEEALLKTHDISLMVFAEDNEEYFTPQLIKLGHQKNIKSVVFPYTFANHLEFLEEAFLNDRRVNKNIFNFIAGRLFPKYTRDYKGKKLIRNYPSYIFASEIFKTSPLNPWVMSSGDADVIAVESSFMKEYYQLAGIPEGQMIETGTPSLDLLYEIHYKKTSYKEELAQRFGLDKNKPWVLCALPPYQKTKDFQFKNYDHFIESFVAATAKFDNVEVIFKFHPRFDTMEIQNMCQKFGVKYIPEDTLNLIAVSDLYVASVSSTIRWALALGIPTINFDVYDFNYGDFEGAENYHVVNRMKDFDIIFSQLCQKLHATQSETKRHLQTRFAVLDGNSQNRILDLFSKLTAAL